VHQALLLGIDINCFFLLSIVSGFLITLAQQTTVLPRLSCLHKHVELH